MSDIIISEVNGVDVVQYQPKGVCSKMMQIRIKDNIIQHIECIVVLVKGLHIDEVVGKLQGIPCGSRPTSCPDQLSKGLAAYAEAKSTVKA